MKTKNSPGCVRHPGGGRTWQKLFKGHRDAEHPLTPPNPYYNDKLYCCRVFNYDM